MLVTEAGLYISQDKPSIGASPDGIIVCDCCGTGALEIKCPFCIKEELTDTPPPGLCMERDENGVWKLKQEHACFYQVQVHLNVCQLEYGDFVLWTENGLAIERITRDTTFYEQNTDSVKHFFVYGILPEIVGK